MAEPSRMRAYAIVSDFHLAEGRNPRTRRISRLENFFGDHAFERLLEHLRARADRDGTRWTLVFNGDLIDFLRITSIPDPASMPQGFPRITSTKTKYGLGTSPAESKWQMERAVEGHPVFFRALASFLLAGQEVVIIPGNHDVNWFWPEVRYRFFELMEELLRDVCPAGPGSEAALSAALDRIEMRSWSLFVPGLLYVEHGNQYDAANAFRNYLHPLLMDPDSPVDRYELDLPFGSFFVRYFFNKVEMQSPAAPNYRHAASYLYTLWRRHFYASWNVVRSYFPYFFRTIRKVRSRRDPRDRDIRENHLRMVRRLGDEYGTPEAIEKIDDLQEAPAYENKMDFLLAILERPLRKLAMALGGILLLSFVWSLLAGGVLRSDMNPVLRTTLSLILNYGFILTGIALLILVLRPSGEGSSYREADPRVLRRKAARIARLLDVRYVVFGHCHQEDVWPLPQTSGWYFNTGTWIPVIDEEHETVRPAVQFPVLLIERGEATLMRWDDARGALEEAPLLEERDASQAG